LLGNWHLTQEHRRLQRGARWCCDEVKASLLVLNPALTVHVCACDIATEAGRTRLVECVDIFDVKPNLLIDNAGMGDYGSFAECSGRAAAWADGAEHFRRGAADSCAAAAPGGHAGISRSGVECEFAGRESADAGPGGVWGEQGPR